MNAFVPLSRAHPTCGPKAVALGELIRSGFAVPDGVVLPVGTGDDWTHDLPGILATLGGSRFAVRSSALAEDGRSASYAGQFHTALDVAPGHVRAQVRAVAMSGENAGAYAAAIGHPAPQGVAVIVQRMLSPAASGVAFTRDPVTREPITVVEAVPGLGDRLVSGEVSPERWRISPDDVACVVPTGVLSATEAAEIARVAARAEKLLGGGQDVEWAIADGSVWVLQARPITSAPRSIPLPSPRPSARARLLANGTSASPGVARGRLRVISGLDDFEGFQPGEVLVCQTTSPSWMPVLARAGAVVTTHGGVLAHAAIIARELRIPAVTDVAAAMNLPDGTFVEVDGTAGTVTTLVTP